MQKHLSLTLRWCLTLALLFAGCGDKADTLVFQSVTLDVYNSSNQAMANNEALPYTGHSFKAVLPTVTVASVNSFGNAAYAYKPNIPNARLDDKIKDIKIITLKDYNAQLTAGSDITGFCDFIVEDSLVNKQRTLDMVNMMPEQYVGASGFSFRLKSIPAYNKTQQLAIVLITENYSRLTDTTINFQFVP